MNKKIFLSALLVVIILCSFAQQKSLLLLDAGTAIPFSKGYKPGVAAELSAGMIGKKAWNQVLFSAGIQQFKYRYNSSDLNIASFRFGYRSFPDGKGWYLHPSIGVQKAFGLGTSPLNLSLSIGSGYQFPVGHSGNIDLFARFNGSRGNFFWLTTGVGFQFGNQLR